MLPPPFVSIIVVGLMGGCRCQDVHLRRFVTDFIGLRDTASTRLYWTGRNHTGETVRPDIQLVRELQRRHDSYFSAVGLPASAAVEEQILRGPGHRTFHVFLTDDDVIVDFLDKMKSRCLWEWSATCLILSYHSNTTEKLRHRHFPVDTEVVIGQVSNPGDNLTQVDLVEVYHLGRHTPMKSSNLGQWNSVDGMVHWDNRTIFKRRSDWSGLTLRVAVVEATPFSSVTGNQSLDVSGYFGDAWIQLAQILKLDYTVLLDKQYGMLTSAGNWTGVVGMLVRDEADVAVAGLATTKTRKEYVNFTRVLFEIRSHVFVKKPLTGDLSWMTYMGVFDEELWVALFITFFVSTSAMAAMYWIERRYKLASLNEGNFSWMDSILFFISAICQQGAADVPRGLSTRLFFWVFFIIMVVSFAAYSAVLISFLTVQKTVLPFNSFQEFLGDGSYVLGVQNSTSQLQDIQESKNSLIREVKRKHVTVMPNKATIQNRVQHDKSFAYLYSFVGNEDCSLGSFRAEGFSYPLAMAVQKDSPYKIFFDYYLARLQEEGMVDRLESKWMRWPADRCSVSEYPSPGIPTVFSAFVLLAAGMAGSVLLLAAEVLWFRLRKRRDRVKELSCAELPLGVYKQ